MDTIKEAKVYLRENWEEGVDCPCCGQLVRKWRYSLTASVGVCLIKMYRLHNEGFEWVHVNTEIRPTSGGFFSLGKWWGLIELKGKTDEDKRVSGLWRLTEKGKMFVRGELRIKKYIEIFDNKLIGFDGEDIDIRFVLGKRFSYEELMAGYDDSKTTKENNT